jgi:hypothetical protein
LLPDGSTVLSLSNLPGCANLNLGDGRHALIAGYLSLSILPISYLVVTQGGPQFPTS